MVHIDEIYSTGGGSYVDIVSCKQTLNDKWLKDAEMDRFGKDEWIMPRVPTELPEEPLKRDP